MGTPVTVPSGTGYRDVPVRGALTSDGNGGAPLMSMVDANGNTVTSLKVSAGGPAAGQAAKNYTGLITLSGSVQNIALETVTTGKTWFITDIVVTTTSSTALLVAVQAGGVTVFQSHINSTKGIEAMGIETQPYAVAGQAVTLQLPAGSGAVAFNILGVEG